MYALKMARLNMVCQARRLRLVLSDVEAGFMDINFVARIVPRLISFSLITFDMENNLDKIGLFVHLTIEC